jgi:peptidoglycan/LPS O-acetylase OafA/YrhL
VPERTPTGRLRAVPEPIGRGQRYLPALDGLRALAVLAVIAYHVQLGWASGGLLGVGVFFTLSGYLITDLLVGQWQAHGGLRLGDFWLRRARRLLPALFLMLAVVTAWVELSNPAELATLRGDVGAALLYVSNWWVIFHHVSYFAAIGPPSPLGHLWSLAVEEQFYLLWPLLLWAGLRWLGRRRLIGIVLFLAAASAVAMGLLYQPGADPTRVYDGTDTRAFQLLLGAALALAWPRLRPRLAGGPTALRRLDAGGAAGLAVIAALVFATGQSTSFLYQGGMVLLSLATVAVLAAASVQGTRVARTLGWGPLRWLGVRSYGIYLWHYPVIALTTPATRPGFDLPRASLQVTATILVAALSWRFVEEPIRHGWLGRFRARLRLLARDARGRPVPTGSATGLMALSVALAGLVAAAFVGAAAPPNLGGDVADPLPSPVPSSTGGTHNPAVVAPRRITGGAPPTMSSCRSVVHIGDSTSEGLTSADYLPDPAQRMAAQYARVGVRHEYFEISGARSIVETWEDHPNAYTVAQQVLHTGYRGCWVLALGTNDTADVYVGSHVGRMARVQRMMKLIGNQPVLWVNVRSLLSTGPYSEHNMQLWDRTLLQACHRYPTMRVFNWAAVAQPRWYISDGIHYTTPGYRARARLIASALAEAFPTPSERQPSGCLVK